MRSWWQAFSDGRKYMKIWPQHAVVAAMTESWVVPATRHATLWMPIAAAVNFAVQLSWLPTDQLPQIIAGSLFLLLLPLQGYYWLGKRAYALLPPPLKAWYFELQQKLQQAGEDVRTPEHRPAPCYIDLAFMIRKALAVLPPEQH